MAAAPRRTRRGGRLRRWLTVLVAVLLVAAGGLALARGMGWIVMIHDISTDLSDPPAFEAILPLRGDVPNPAAYDGPATAAEQRRTYPELGPLTVSEPVPQALSAAVAAGQGMGWDIVAVDETRGRLEAVATTRLLRFKDDIVVRMRSEASGTRIDVRSKSRVGRSDLGANARRIRAFLDALRQSLTEAPAAG
jgi:hypothetical protein